MIKCLKSYKYDKKKQIRTSLKKVKKKYLTHPQGTIILDKTTIKKETNRQKYEIKKFKKRQK